MNATAPTVAETVAAVKQEILDGIADGTFPADVADFSTLHDFCDANTLGGMCDDGFPQRFRTDEWADAHDIENDPWMIHCNDVQNAVHEWLVAGRPEDDPEARFMAATEDAPLTDAERAEMDAKYAAHAARKA